MNKEGNIKNGKNVSVFLQRAFLCLMLVFLYFSPLRTFAQNKYENRTISDIQIVFVSADKNISAAEQFRIIAKDALGDKYSAVKVRDALDALYQTRKIISAQVEATAIGENQVSVRFIIRRVRQVEKINIQLGPSTGSSAVTEDQILLRTTLNSPGMVVTEQALRNDADSIQTYLRRRGFYNAEVTYKQQPLQDESQTAVTFVVNPGAQARVESFNINIKGFDATKVLKSLKLKSGEYYSGRDLEADVTKVRQALLKEDYVAPQLEDTKITFDSEKNQIAIGITGDVGPKVTVNIDAGKEKVGSSKQQELLAIKREGTLEQSAIVEGERRLQTYFQEQGYFFAKVTSTCSVSPPFPPDPANPLTNGTSDLCAALSGANLEGRTVEVNYKADLNRRLKLVDIRIQGTDKISYAEISSVLDTQRASLIGLIPRLGYGRGYTSNEILSSDAERLRAIMKELGYRNAEVKVRQGVSPSGDDLIITFSVTEGIPTFIRDIELSGNKVFDEAKLRAELPAIEGKEYSRARARNGVQKLSALYAREGYFDAKVSFSLVELPKTASEERVKIVYNIDREGKKVFINRIIINGNDITKRDSILQVITLKEGEVLTSANIFTSEQNLYATDAFERVEIRPEEAGEMQNGDVRRDVIINLEEQKPNIMTYGGGYSTDVGPTGFFDIRNVNMFGKLQQGGARVRMSSRQQLVQLDYLNPRFLPDGKNGFAPLRVTAQYQRDSTVTRFFRSTFDSGTSGVVQRIDADGNPIDQLGNQVSDPTINRLTLTAETQRTIDRNTRSFLYVRYRYEDVRIFNVDSLLIGELLRPDEKVRTSGFGATFVRDTRQNCNRRYTVLELVSKGELGDPCRYSSSDPTRGSYLTLEYNVSAPQLGGNIGFQKFQGNYQTYYQLPKLGKKLDNVLFAGRAILGLANVFSRKQTFVGPLAQLNRSLPISERFFAGGSTTLRGFEFESAGPRVVVLPQGAFRDQEGNTIFLNPFTVPFGGNALAITNLELRVPLTESFQVVPFYDGGNVFNRVGDIFKPLKQATGDAFTDNLRATWKHTFGLGFRLKTPFGGSVAVDYGFLLNPPRFLIPQASGTDAIYQIRQGQLHFRFAQSF